MDQIAQYLPYILNGVAGAALAPLVAGLLGGRGLGAVINIILGTDATMGYVQDLIEGALGGAVLGLILSFIKGR